MQITIKLLMMVLLAISAQNAFSTQSQDQSASPEQQTPPDAQGQASRSAVAKSVTGCVVQGDHGYSLKTESETYPLETEKDLSQYVNKPCRTFASGRLCPWWETARSPQSNRFLAHELLCKQGGSIACLTLTQRLPAIHLMGRLRLRPVYRFSTFRLVVPPSQ